MQSNILIIPRPHIGDFIWATSAVALIKKHLPDSDITVIAPESLLELINNNPVFDKVYSYDLKLFESPNIFLKASYRLLLFIKSFFALRKLSFDICFLFSPFEFFIKLSAFLKVKEIAYSVTECCGNNKQSTEDKILSVVAGQKSLKPIPTSINADFNHYSEIFQNIVRGYFSLSNIALPLIPLSDKYKENIAALIRTAKPIKIAICTQASKNSKNYWPQENFKKVIENISSRFQCAFFVVGGAEQVNKTESLITSADKSVEIHNLRGKTSLLGLRELFKNIDLLISVDTGVTHIAATTDINIITLCGMAAPEAVMPMSPKNISIYANTNCSPCVYAMAFEKKKCDNNKCMQLITPETVIAETVKVLEKKQ